MVEQSESNKRREGGRPTKAIKRSYPVTVKCTILEKKVLVRKAKEAALTLSEYLRITGLNGNIVMRKMVLPKEFLEYKAVLFQMAFHLGEIRRNMNGIGDVNELHKEYLSQIEKELKEHIEKMQKAFLK